MISGLNVGAQPRATQGGGSAKGSQNSGARKTDSADFADQLLGAKPGGTENLDRNERTKNSGRDSNREEKRSNDSEKDSKSTVASRDKRSSERTERKAKRDERLDSNRAPASDFAPIVVEPKKVEEAPEMRLPDFFSKVDAAGAKDATKLTAEGEVATGETVDLLSSMKQGEAQTREQAMTQFMESMQEELGIPPEKILQALSNLDASALQAPPEETVTQFIDGLDLLDGNDERASELYQELLKTTGDSLITEKVAGLDKSVNFDIMSSRDASKKSISSALDDMNSSFFGAVGAKASAQEPKKAQAALESMDAALAKLMKGETPVAATTLASVKPVEVTEIAATPSTSATNAEALAGILSAQANPLAAALRAGSDESDLSFLSDESEATSLMAGEKEVSTDFASELAENDEIGSDAGSEISTEILADGDVAAGTTPIATALAQGSKSASVTGPADMMMNRQPTSADEQANIRDLIQNARLMVKRGGGEMKVEMTPEGMGKVQLKVAVENGQVNVQMLTESDSAKRLLEKGMNELRTSLAAHDLKVETMRIDVGNEVSKQMDQQGTQDQARQQARQFAQDFMGSFRDERQGFRQGMMEQNGWRSYGRNQRRENIGPEVSSSVSAGASAKSNGDKRLNVVA